MVLELFERCSPIQCFAGVVPDSTLDAQPVATEEERIPIVHSFTVWKMCEALDLKAKFVPLPVLPRTPHRGKDQTTTAPVVASFSVWKICQALELPATYDPQLIRTTVFRKPHKPIPVVQSTAVFELCKDEDHERDADHPNSTLIPHKSHKYSVDKQAKEEVAGVGLNRSLEQSLQHVGVHYPSER
ncbi:hypothetical protein TNCV_5103861 [Trichonephila clavipes]|nr:hypothetical protein TNCV_5103861 [Trichonephila clavipes]